MNNASQTSTSSLGLHGGQQLRGKTALAFRPSIEPRVFLLVRAAVCDALAQLLVHFGQLLAPLFFFGALGLAVTLHAGLIEAWFAALGHALAVPPHLQAGLASLLYLSRVMCRVEG